MRKLSGAASSQRIGQRCTPPPTTGDQAAILGMKGDAARVSQLEEGDAPAVAQSPQVDAPVTGGRQESPVRTEVHAPNLAIARRATERPAHRASAGQFPELDHRALPCPGQQTVIRTELDSLNVALLTQEFSPGHGVPES